MFTKTKIRTIIMLLAVACLAFSCKKENGTENTTGSDIKKNAVEFSQQHDMYVKQIDLI